MNRANRAMGVTLVELLVAMVIVSILAAIAMPSYRSYQLKAQRQVGAACLIEAGRRAQTYQQRKGAYPTSLTQIGYPAAQSSCRDSVYFVIFDTTRSFCTTAKGGGFTIKASTITTSQADGQLFLTQCYDGTSERYRDAGDNTW